MMNPATQLAEMLEQWTVKANTQPEVARGLVSGRPDDVEFWRSQGRAAQLLSEVERLLASMKANDFPVDHFDTLLPKWYQAVFAFQTPWQTKTSGQRRPISLESLAALRGLGTTIELFASEAHLSPTEQETLMALLSDVADLIADDQSIPQAERRYMWGLVKETQRCLEEVSVFGTASLRNTVNELSGAVMKEAARSAQVGDRKRSSKLLRAAMHLANTFGTVVVTEGAQFAIETGKDFFNASIGA